MAKRLLIVDDEKGYTMTLRRKLELQGYEIDESHSGADALKRLMETTYDLVLLDYMMPDLRGNKLCAMIREDERTRDVPVIVVTAYHDQSEESLKAYGATEVIYKPVATEDLLLRIRKYL